MILLFTEAIMYLHILLRISNYVQIKVKMSIESDFCSTDTIWFDLLFYNNTK